ncbi:MAG: putative lipid II flippase FtsW [Burkholderiaceae bacterium]|jgi:cell division protein FtsW|nr:putative lipid II flippase FtsW [Burkholderiaceae bacterium]
MSTLRSMTAALPAIRAWIGKQRVPFAQHSKMMRWDYPLFIVALILLMLGLVMVYSASVTLPDLPRLFPNLKSTHFLRRQALFIFIGISLGLIAWRIPTDIWQKCAPYLLVLSIILLGLVFVPGIRAETGDGVTRGIKGAYRWLNFRFFNFQPSELLKLVIILYAADFVVRKQSAMKKLKGFLPMLCVLVVVISLLLKEPDLGTSVIVACVVMGVLFLGGSNMLWFAVLIPLLGTVCAAVIFFVAEKSSRIMGWWDRWNPLYAKAAYQLQHSLVAFGRGELFGVGLGSGVEKLNYLPDRHTDFLLAMIGEELGLIGVLAVILLFYWLIKRGFDIGRQALQMDRHFAGLAAQGISIWIGIQAFFHMGVNLGLLPTKGTTLPLMSYGGSGILINCVALAILLRIDYENRAIMRGGKK